MLRILANENVPLDVVERLLVRRDSGRFVLRAGIVAWAVACAPAQTPAAEARDEQAEATSAKSPEIDEVLTRLRRTQRKELLTFLERIDGYVRGLSLNNEQLDQLITEVKRIEAVDSHQEMEWPFKVPHDPDKGHLVFVNRRAATGAIEVLGFHKIANDLRVLPFEERIERMIEIFEGHAVADSYSHASGWFGGELWRIGKEAVPLLLKHAEQAQDHQLRYVGLLSSIGDPRAIDFILNSLRGLPAQETSKRCEIIRSLNGFRDPRVIEALVESVQDDIRALGDARPSQRRQPASQTHPVRYFPVRMCAAQTLGEITGEHWGMLFGEDPESWLVWQAASDRKAFDPVDVPRSNQALAAVVENFTYRCMMEYMRSAAWEHKGIEDQYLLKDEVAELRRLGPRVVPFLVEAYRSITAEFPVWENDLRNWTQRLLEAIDCPEANQAASQLERR